MVFRSLYFLNRAQLQNSELQLIPWLVEHHRSKGLIKAVRRRHRTNAQRPLSLHMGASLNGHANGEDTHPTKII